MPAEVVFLVCLGHERVIAVFQKADQAAIYVEELKRFARLLNARRDFTVKEWNVLDP